MSKLITFVDSGVLITAIRGHDPLLKKRALNLLTDPQREFASSAFIRLEVMPKAIWIKNQTEQDFYDFFFNSVRHWLVDYAAVIAEAEQEAKTYGLGAWTRCTLRRLSY